MKSLGTLFLGFALFAVPAAAQTVVSTQEPYAPLSAGATPLTFSHLVNDTADVLDDGYASLPLGFTFPYFGLNVTTVGVTTNGLILVDPAAQTYCASNKCNSTRGIPGTATEPHGFIAPWWRDLQGTSGQVRWTRPRAGEIVIEFFDWGYFADAPNPAGLAEFSFQVRLDDTGRIQVHYGTHSTKAVTAIGNGWEDATGAQGGNLLSCGTNASCTNASWPTNTRFHIGAIPEPELYVPTVALASLLKSGSDVTFDVTPTFTNAGQSPANDFHWKAYLSTDATLSADDQVVYDSSASGQPVSVAAASSTTVTASASATSVSNGNYYVLVAADSTGVISELFETNNVGRTSSTIAAGVDFVASGINAPAQVTAWKPASLTVNWSNPGIEAAPTPGNVVTYRVILSKDKTASDDDFVAYEGTETVLGQTTFANKAISFPMKGNAPRGAYYVGLQLDYDATVTELSETNNVVFTSAQTTVFQSDLQPMSVELLDPVTRSPTRLGLLGEKGRLRVTVNNAGAADAKDFQIGVILSTDGTPSLLNDPLIHDEPVDVIAAGATGIVEFDFTIPTTNDITKTSYKTGSYYFFAFADSFRTVVEENEENNTLALKSGGEVAPVYLHTPASDYVAVNLQAPSTGAVGELVPVSRIIRNVGNLDGKTVSYRFFLSANSIIDPADQALRIIGPNGAPLDDAQITLPEGAADSRTELLELPYGLQAGTWYVGLIVDFGDVDAELDEANNALASSAPIQLTASSLVINNQQLPDALAELPYSFKLSASAGDEAVQWTILDGARPDGMALSTDGVLSGTPAAPGLFTFLAEAKTATRTVAKWLVLRVLAGPDQLVITTTGLPPVINNTQRTYEAQLAAAGGVKDYAWSLISGALPNGLALSTSGKLSGAVRSGVRNGPTDLVFEVADQLGTRARAKITITVVAPGSLQIGTTAMPDAMVNNDYSADLDAANSDGTALAAPLTWKIISGRLPEGMALSSYSPTKGLVTGKPLEIGTFPFTLQVMDKDGRIDTTDLIFTVHAAFLELTALNAPGTVNPGAAVDMQVTTGNPASTYRLYAGALPPGLTLTADGKISGTIEDSEASVGTWNFVVEAQTPTVGASLAPFAIEVVAVPVAQGCDSAPTSSPLGVMAVLAFAAAFALRRRGARAG